MPRKTELSIVCKHGTTERHVSLIYLVSVDRWFIFSSFPFPADPTDVLRLLGLSENMEGVSLEAGLCTDRRGMEETDIAYSIKKIQLSAPTKQLFPGSASMFFLQEQSPSAVKYSEVTQKWQKALSIYDCNVTSIIIR